MLIKELKDRISKLTLKTHVILVLITTILVSVIYIGVHAYQCSQMSNDQKRETFRTSQLRNKAFNDVGIRLMYQESQCSYSLNDSRPVSYYSASQILLYDNNSYISNFVSVDQRLNFGPIDTVTNIYRKSNIASDLSKFEKKQFNNLTVFSFPHNQKPTSKSYFTNAYLISSDGKTWRFFSTLSFDFDQKNYMLGYIRNDSPEKHVSSYNPRIINGDLLFSKPEKDSLISFYYIDFETEDKSAVVRMFFYTTDYTSETEVAEQAQYPNPPKYVPYNATKLMETIPAPGSTLGDSIQTQLLTKYLAEHEEL